MVTIKKYIELKFVIEGEYSPAEPDVGAPAETWINDIIFKGESLYYNSSKCHSCD